MLIYIFDLIKRMKKCKHEWEVINPEEVADGFNAIKKCKKCGCWLN